MSGQFGRELWLAGWMEASMQVLSEACYHMDALMPPRLQRWEHERNTPPSGEFGFINPLNARNVSCCVYHGGEPCPWEKERA